MSESDRPFGQMPDASAFDWPGDIAELLEGEMKGKTAAEKRKREKLARELRAMEERRKARG
ncbi:hypothetical protein [Crystallibacter degradans]|uniref:hypothetical protein n=1 Tax=Crystallibacter degradans TaxID=2726743 RepID=UPI0014741716|nr:hypothetical protein [Arthrobacter sp. SF27]NMR29947.1 hypothetical protein [Arthrobacter sp. SF27]